MIPDLKGKVVLVTGASTGIGAAVARAFGAEGSTVVVHYHASEAAAREVVAAIEIDGGRGHAMRADATHPEQMAGLVKATVDRYGHLDVLINNVGDLVRRCPIADSSEELFDAVVDLNVRSVVTTSRAAIPHFRAQGRGNIINTTSIAARNGGGPGIGAVCEFEGVRQHVHAGPGQGTRAGEDPRQRRGARRHRHAAAGTAHHATQMEAFRTSVPMGRLGSAEECAGAYLYLASDALSGYVTGQILEINGGQLMP